MNLCLNCCYIGNKPVVITHFYTGKELSSSEVTQHYIVGQDYGLIM